MLQLTDPLMAVVALVFLQLVFGLIWFIRLQKKKKEENHSS